jgi:hypothetical protein
MSLNQNHITYLKSRAARGDLDAEAILEAMLTEQTLGEAKIVTLINVAAKQANDVLGAAYGDAAADAGKAYTTFTAGIANPAVPRNIRCTFGHTWDGGNVTINGTDQFGKVQNEVFNAAIDSVVVGVKVFKTVTSIVKAAVGSGTHATNTCQVGTGDKLACGSAKLTQPFAECRLDSGAEDAVVIDQAASAFTPTTVPNGAVDYSLLVYTEAIYND